MNIPVVTAARPVRALPRPTADDRPVLSEFSIAILSLLCVSMGIGSNLPREFGELITCAGVLGLLAYAIRVSRKQEERRVQTVQGQKRVEARLENHAVRGLWQSCTESVTSLFDSLRAR